MKIKKILFFLTLLYIGCLSIGYAFFRESLLIEGIATTAPYYEGDALPNTPIIMDSANNRYHLEEGHKNNVDFSSESWDGNTLHIYYDKKFGVVVGQVTSTYVVRFSNPTVLTMFNGTVETSTINNGLGYISASSATISKTELLPEETLEIRFSITHNMLSSFGTQEIQAAISFDFQNTRKYFYVVVHYE